jgi:hypothetical protein
MDTSSSSQLTNPNRIQFYYDGELNKVGGFGWMNDNQFCYGSYSSAEKPLHTLSRPEDFILK